MTITVLEPYSLFSLARLRAAANVTIDEKLSLATEILLIRSRTKVDKKLLEAAPALKLIVTATSGFDHIDWRECQKRNVTVAHTPEANAQSTAELTFALLLGFERQIVAAHKNVKQGKWKEGLQRPRGLEGRTMGIVGLGRVGSRVARLATAFGLKLLGYDPYVDESVFKKLDIERIGFIELLRTSDIVTMHVPLTKETKHMLALPTFNEMSNDAIILNTCRGPVVDESDLLAALDDGTIAGAAMDVIEREPPAQGNRLLSHPKLLLTPHIGAFTTSAWENASNEAVEKALAFRAHQAISDTLPLQTAWFPQT